MQQEVSTRVSFTVRQRSCALYPITAVQGATRQVHAERLVCELADPADMQTIGFDYHTEATGDGLDVVLTVHGADEIRVREVAQRLDEHYHGQPFYEKEVDNS